MKLSLKTKISYGVGNLGYASLAQTVNNFIMFFGTSVLGISGTLVGLAVALSTFWDGISDPLIGHFSDNFHSKKYGKRIGFMIFGTIGMIVFNILLWSVPVASEGVMFVWLLVCLLCLETFCTTFSTPYVALGIDLAPEYAEQNKLQGFKTVFFILGMILPSALMFIFMPSGAGQAQFNQSGYINIAYVTSGICFVAGLVSILGTKKAESKIYQNHPPQKNENAFRAFFKIFYKFFTVLKKPNFSSIIVGYSVALISTAFLSSVGLHLFTYGFHFTSFQIACLMGALFLMAIVSQVFWIYLAGRLDKKPALLVSLAVVLLGIAFTALTFIVRAYIPTATLFYFVLFGLAICGFGTGALYSLPISMYADCVSIERAQSGENNSGVYSGFMTLAYNISNCLALFVVGVLLDIIRFNPAQPVQALVVQNWMGVIVFVGCALAIFCALLIFRKYTLKRSEILKARLKNQKSN